MNMSTGIITAEGQKGDGGGGVGAEEEEIVKIVATKVSIRFHSK